MIEKIELKIERFRALLEHQQTEVMQRIIPSAPACRVKVERVFQGALLRSHPGRWYPASYLVTLDALEIFGVDERTRGRNSFSYGTLDTIREWGWGESRAKPFRGTPPR